jgi:hypothetical protein
MRRLVIRGVTTFGLDWIEEASKNQKLHTSRSLVKARGLEITTSLKDEVITFTAPV